MVIHCTVLKFMVLALPLCAGQVALSQERGEAPSVGEENTIRALRQDSTIAPGFDAADQVRSRAVRSLERNAAHRQKRNALTEAAFERLLKDQTARRESRDARRLDPSARRADRRRARTDRRLRARINRALRRN